MYNYESLLYPVEAHRPCGSMSFSIAIPSLPQLNWGALACSAHKKACWRNEGFSNTMESGDDLPSRAVSSQVLSACGGLTSVFGMGTGGSLQLLSPEIVCTSQTVCSLAPGLSRPASAFRSAHPENCTGKADLSFSNWSSFR